MVQWARQQLKLELDRRLNELAAINKSQPRVFHSTTNGTSLLQQSWVHLFHNKTIFMQGII